MKLQNTLAQGHIRLKIATYFHIYIQQVSLLLVYATQMLFFVPKYKKISHKHAQKHKNPRLSFSLFNDL